MRTIMRFFRATVAGLTFALICMPLQLSANAYPLLFHYSYEQYGVEADLQNWDITQSEAGEIFVGNNNCMLRFDSFNWQRVSSYGDRIYRSACAVGDRIYIGRHDEFGFLTRDDFGDYSFTSLSAGKPVMQHNEEIWNIISLDSTVYFQSFYSVYAFSHDSLTTLDLPFFPYCIYSDSAYLYVQAMGGNFYRLEDSGPRLLFTRQKIGNSDVVGFMKTDKANDYFVVTNSSGIFRYSDGQIRKFHTRADEQLQNFAINKAVLTKDGMLVLGTFRTGIICINKDGEIAWHYHAKNGLKNACVLRLLCDKTNNIWACLDDGIALIASGSPYSIISSGNAEQAMGMVYSICRQDDELFIATNQGVYRCKPESTSPALTLVPGTEGQNWHLTEIEGTLYCGQNSSLLSYRNGQFQKVPGTNNSSTCMRLFQHYNENCIIESTYSDLRLHKKKDGHWADPVIIKGFMHPLRQLEADADGIIWAADMNIGIHRISLSDDLLSVQEARYYSEIGGISARCFVMKLGGQVLFSNGERLYRYDDSSDSFLPYERLNSILPRTEGIISISENRDGTRGKYWIGSREGFALIAKQGDQWQLLHAIRSTALGYKSNDVAARAYVAGGCTYFNLADAVVIYDSRMSAEKQAAQFFLHKAQTLDRHGNFTQLNVEDLKSGKLRIGGNIFLQFSYPDYPAEEVRFVFEVKSPRQTTIQHSDRPEVLLTGLSNGRKHLTAKAIAPDGTELRSLQISFRVLPPWYRSWWAIVGYILLAFLIAQILVKYQVRKKTERQRLQLLEQDRIISEQKQQLLEQELQIKSKDLASLSLEAGLKDNVIDSIQHAIREQQKQGKIAQGTFNAELLRIKQTTGSEKNWAVFQQNFDLIHEHFFRHLKERYPGLTTSDMRLCALLRLNMSTKDIATYTGLSVRGVESARFRLRKKLGLDAEQNLSEFLLAFK